MKKATDIVFTVLMVLIIIFAFLLVGMRLFGLTPYTVLSGSMEPEYMTGSLIYVRRAKAEELTVGVPVTYKMESGIIVTHRIVEVIYDEDNPTSVKYRTKGDANDTSDSPIEASNVIGIPVFDIPFLGYITHFVQNPPGIYIAIIAIALLIIFAFLPDVLFRDKNEN